LDWNLKMMRLIGRILNSDRNGSETEQPRILPVLRLTVAFSCILLCALSGNAVFVVGVLAVELMRLAMMPEAGMRHVLKLLVLPVLFTILMLLPSVFMGYPRTMLTVGMKVLESVLVLAVMNEDLSWKDITEAFHSLHAPQIFVLTLDMTVRYLVILGRYANEIMEAVWLRSAAGGESGSGAAGAAGENRRTVPVDTGETYHKASRRKRDARVGGVLGTTFLKSQKMAAETAEAMECRGFTGEYRSFSKHRTGVADMLYALLIPLLVLLFLYTEKAV
jgi:cobalt/nickel transport system permease protein